jgi:hypothetical protein
MSIVYKMLPDGGFLVGDTETRRTRYAGPTNPRAIEARNDPRKIATAMMADENDIKSWLRNDSKYVDRDTVRWLELEREEP